jgi:hypothetical protein
MLLAALSLAYVANDYAPPRTATPRYERVATASVIIVAAEKIAPLRESAEDRKSNRRATARQRRMRDNMPLVEFY